MNDIRTTPTCALVVMLTEAEEQGNQELVNICAYELAYRIYIPNKGKAFETLLNDFGYREIEKPIKKQKLR